MGDISHSRVAKSNIYCLKKLGATIRLIAPHTLIPPGIEGEVAEVCHSIEAGITGVDVIMTLRIQRERQTGGFFSSTDEYFKFWGLTRRRLQRAAPEVIVMHPGPMNRGVEIASEVADSRHSAINAQVTNGLAVRMAVLYLLDNARPRN